MRIDGPKGLGAWLTGFFSGSFKGNLEGTASYAETASYIRVENVDGIKEQYLNLGGGTVSGSLILSGSQELNPRLTVHGNIKVVSGSFEHGENTNASGDSSHAEGKDTVAEGAHSHAEGRKTKAVGVGAHAEGYETVAMGVGSHAEGKGTVARSDFQHVEGRYNLRDYDEKYAFIIGNGTSDESRSNAFTVDWEGNVEANKLIVKETMSIEHFEVGDLIVSNSLLSPDINSVQLTSSYIQAGNVNANNVKADVQVSAPVVITNKVSASLIEAQDIKADTFSISQSLQSPIVIATDKIVAGDVDTTEIVGPEVKTGKIIVRQYYGDPEIQPIDRVLLDYNSGSKSLEFNFLL